jgi:hypothetical protein
MRATTVRFGTDLWAMLELEAKRSGVSVAQYVREAALARLAFSAGVRGDETPWGSRPGEEEGTSRELSQALRATSRALSTQAEAIAAQSKSLDARARDELRQESRAVIAQSQQILRESERIQKRFPP